MTPFERLKTLVEFNLSDAVPEEKVDMTYYSKSDFSDMRAGCMTSGCRAGWGTQCPSLQEEGYTMNMESQRINIHGYRVGHTDRMFLNFFGIRNEESIAFFSVDNSGSKEELRETWEDYLSARYQPGLCF